MNRIDHIVFDVGRVLINWDAGLIYHDLILDETQRKEFLEICAPWNAGAGSGCSKLARGRRPADRRSSRQGGVDTRLSTKLAQEHSQCP